MQKNVLAHKQQLETEQSGDIGWLIVLSKAITFLIVYSFHFSPSPASFTFLLYVLSWFILEVGEVPHKANNPARYLNKAKIIYLLCLSAPPSFSNMRRSRYDFVWTASSASANVSHAYKSDSSQKTPCAKTWQIRMILRWEHEVHRLIHVDFQRLRKKPRKVFVSSRMRANFSKGANALIILFFLLCHLFKTVQT